MQMITQGLRDKSFIFFLPLMDMDKDEIVKGLEDLSRAASLV